jgi:hypothetical protein
MPLQPDDKIDPGLGTLARAKDEGDLAHLNAIALGQDD